MYLSLVAAGDGRPIDMSAMEQLHLERHAVTVLNTLSSVLYLVAVSAWVYFTLLSGSYLMELPCRDFLQTISDYIIDYILTLLFIVLIFDSYVNGVSFWRIAVAVILGLIVQVDTNANYELQLLCSFGFLISYPRNLKLKSVAICVSITFSILIAIVVILFFLGFLPDRVQDQHGMIRHSFGFTWPNCLSYYSTAAVICWAYANKDSWAIWKLVLPLFVLCVVFLFANGRVAFFLGIAVLVFVSIHALVSAKKRINLGAPSWFYATAKWSFPCMMLLCLLLVFIALFNEGVRGILYHTWGFRFQMMVAFVDDYGIELFGQNISLVSWAEHEATGLPWANIDNACILGTLKYGLLFTIVISVLNYYLAVFAQKMNNPLLAFLIIIMAICSLTENLPLNPAINFCFFAAGYMVSVNCSRPRALSKSIARGCV